MRRRRLKTPLPSSCSDCREFQGLWRRNENGGLERCTCARGRALADTRRPLARKKASFDAKSAAANNK